MRYWTCMRKILRRHTKKYIFIKKNGVPFYMISIPEENFSFSSQARKKLNNTLQKYRRSPKLFTDSIENVKITPL